MNASEIFHSCGILQSKTFVQDLIFFIFNLGNSFLIILRVFLIPLPVKLLFKGNNVFFAKK